MMTQHFIIVRIPHGRIMDVADGSRSQNFSWVYYTTRPNMMPHYPACIHMPFIRLTKKVATIIQLPAQIFVICLFVHSHQHCPHNCSLIYTSFWHRYTSNYAPTYLIEWLVSAYRVWGPIKNQMLIIFCLSYRSSWFWDLASRSVVYCMQILWTGPDSTRLDFMLSHGLRLSTPKTLSYYGP